MFVRLVGHIETDRQTDTGRQRRVDTGSLFRTRPNPPLLVWPNYSHTLLIFSHFDTFIFSIIYINAHSHIVVSIKYVFITIEYSFPVRFGGGQNLTFTHHCSSRTRHLYSLIRNTMLRLRRCQRLT